MAEHPLDRRPADVAGGPLDDPVRHALTSVVAGTMDQHPDGRGGRPACPGGPRYSADDRNDGSASSRPTAAATCFGFAERLSFSPAPRTTTRVVLSGWSRPIGMQSSGTPAASAFTTVPCPAGDDRGDVLQDLRAARPDDLHVGRRPHLVGRDRRAGRDQAAHREPTETVDDPLERADLILKVLLRATSTSGSSPGGGVHGSTQAGSARRGPT